MKLSIGQAWDDAKVVFRADGKAIFAIALALTVLPGAIIETAAPSSTRTVDTPVWIGLLGLVAALLSLTSQIAISRIALGHQSTVGEALTHAFRRMPALFGALLLAILPFALLLSVLSYSIQTNFDPANIPPSILIPMVLVLLVSLYVLIRLMFLTPLAADRTIGPIAMLREAWQLSRGRFLKLLVLFLLLMLVGLLLLAALGGALSSVVVLALGAIAPGSVSALLVALIQQTLAAAVSALFVVVACRLYLQATGGSASVSVPHAGHD